VLNNSNGKTKPLLCAFRISEKKFRQLLHYFAMGFSATDVAQLIGIRRKAVTVIFLKIRQRIAEECERASPFSGEVEIDESYFGAHRVRGKRGRGASGKTPVFGLLKRNGKVYTGIVPDCSKAILQAIIRDRIAPATVIHSDGWRGYNGLVDVGYSKHYRVNHGKNELPVERTISTALRASGAMLNIACRSFTVSRRIPSTCA
jgi:transposase